MTNRAIIKWPAAGRLRLPFSRIAMNPRTTAPVPIKRALVPKPEIVIASSQGIANSSNQREVNASLPRPVSSSALAKGRVPTFLAGLIEAQSPGGAASGADSVMPVQPFGYTGESAIALLSENDDAPGKL